MAVSSEIRQMPPAGQCRGQKRSAAPVFQCALRIRNLGVSSGSYLSRPIHWATRASESLLAASMTHHHGLVKHPCCRSLSPHFQFSGFANPGKSGLVIQYISRKGGIRVATLGSIVECARTGGRRATPDFLFSTVLQAGKPSCKLCQNPPWDAD